jgi:type II secretory pathway component GspD/PulD (secretin)
MNSMIVQDRNSKLEEYLQLLRSMAFELERAMSAISVNSIQGLEDSLANQEAFSTRLVELADDLSGPVQKEPLAVRGSADDDLLQRVRAASNELQSLNRRYSALLKYSSRSVAMMVSLFSSYEGQIQEVSGPRLKLQTWSCQI